MRFNNINNKSRVPMKYFTQKEAQPSEKTLKIIRQIAYTLEGKTLIGKQEVFCFNKYFKTT